MRGPTCVVWANITHFLLQRLLRLAVERWAGVAITTGHLPLGYPRAARAWNARLQQAVRRTMRFR